MRKTVISILFLFAAALQAATYSSTLSEARAVQMENYKEKESAIFERVESIIMRTSNFAITRADIQQAWSLPYTYWNNFEKEPCTVAGDYCVGNTGAGINLIIDPLNKQISLENSLGASPNEENIRLYSKDRTDEVIVDALNSAIRPFSVALSNMYELYTQIIANPLNEISTTPPADTSKTWYKPNGYGGYDIYSFIDGAWKKVGLADSDGKSEIFAATEAELLAIPCTLGTKGYVGDGTTAAQYVCGLNGTWETLSTASDGGGLFNGTANILAMATTLFTKDGGSIADSEAPDGEWGGSKTFTKKDDIVTGGYWKTDDNAYMVTNTIESLSALSSLFLEGTTAWIANGTDDIYKLQKKTLPNGSIAWVYITKDYGTLLSYDTAPTSNGDGVYILVTDHTEYFYYNAEIFNPHPSGAGITFVSKSTQGRDIFVPTTAKTYLLQPNDCDALTCNGEVDTNYYAGTQIDGLYAFYYSTTGNNKNNLTDATPYTSWAGFWGDAAAAVQWNGALFGEVPTGAILIKETLNGDIVYSYGGNYVNKANGFEIPQNILPSGLKATTATITRDLGINYVNVSNLDTFVTDTNLGTGYTVNLTGSGFTNKKITRCLNYSDDNQWSDNCSNIAGATMVASSGSRSDLIAPSSSTRVNLTKQVGTEPNYTTTGVTYSSDAGYLQWFYSTTGTITNNMLDGVPCSGRDCYANATAKSVGIAINDDGKLLNWNGTYWRLASNLSLYVDTGNTYISNAYIQGITGNRLYYYCTNGTQNQQNAKSYCNANRNGMRLPTFAETTASTSIGVTACNTSIGASGFTYNWTSTATSRNVFRVWKGTSYMTFISPYGGDTHPFTCVK